MFAQPKIMSVQAIELLKTKEFIKPPNLQKFWKTHEIDFESFPKSLKREIGKLKIVDPGDLWEGANRDSDDRNYTFKEKIKIPNEWFILRTSGDNWVLVHATSKKIDAIAPIESHFYSGSRDFNKEMGWPLEKGEGW